MSVNTLGNVDLDSNTELAECIAKPKQMITNAAYEGTLRALQRAGLFPEGDPSLAPTAWSLRNR